MNLVGTPQGYLLPVIAYEYVIVAGARVSSPAKLHTVVQVPFVRPLNEALVKIPVDD